MDERKQPAPNEDTEDPRGKDVGQGYPEENQPGTSPGGAPDRGSGDDAPENPDGDPGQATGNPGAAGAKQDV
ncbi:hypothetical protein LRS13_07995 [Svornostia abyssi]|uniref:Uncharacterized protein n=1 Tax=Svornostia abyssi TaxID=2898438 RepID=A0ABY5PLC8_9ACTN|nr:hypothetical protein LRS13_07995 [Parviterribacteraceae bacterium J379]